MLNIRFCNVNYNVKCDLSRSYATANEQVISATTSGEAKDIMLCTEEPCHVTRNHRETISSETCFQKNNKNGQAANCE
jgi:hypothetical protein